MLCDINNFPRDNISNSNRDNSISWLLGYLTVRPGHYDQDAELGWCRGRHVPTHAITLPVSQILLHQLFENNQIIIPPLHNRRKFNDVKNCLNIIRNYRNCHKERSCSLNSEARFASSLKEILKGPIALKS